MVANHEKDVVNWKMQCKRLRVENVSQELAKEASTAQEAQTTI
jgi:hypothetical protein